MSARYAVGCDGANSTVRSLLEVPVTDLGFVYDWLIVDGTSPAPGLPGIGTGLVHPTAPHAGTRLVQGRDGGRRFDDVHGTGWRLVTLGAAAGHAVDVDGIGCAERAWFASIGGTVVALRDPDPLLARWFAEHGTAWALQRPDVHLYGTAPDAATATALLADLRHHLARGTTT